MKSHSYHLSLADWTGLFLPPLLVFAVIVLATHLWAASGQAPGSVPLDIESIVLAEKERATTCAQDADILITGDSSCLMGFSAPALDKLLAPHRTYNLGTLSTLGMERLGEFAGAYLAANSNTATTLVLLISPEMVNGSSVSNTPVQEYVPADPEMRRRIQEARAESARFADAARIDPLMRLSSILALPYIKTQMVDRVFQEPFDGPFGWQYGLPSGIRQHLRSEKGSAIDPSSAEERPQDRNTNQSPYEISSAMKPLCEAFRAKLPSRIRFIVGLTPVPSSKSHPDFLRSRDRILRELAQYLRADSALFSLPAVLPGHYFSTTTHLNEDGVRLYTRILARTLKPHLADADHRD